MDGFRYSFTPLTGVLFTFPSRYWFTIGRGVMFSLGWWSTRIPTRFLVPRGTRERNGKEPRLSPTGLSPSSAALSSDLRLGGFLVTFWLAPCSAPQPPENRSPRGLGCSAFARRY